MTDREMLMLAYGAMKATGDPLEDVVKLIELHVFHEPSRAEAEELGRLLEEAAEAIMSIELQRRLIEESKKWKGN